MRLRHALVLVVAVGALVPGAARAEHCNNPIYVFSTTRIQTDVDDPTNPGTPVGRTVPSAVSSAIGCTVVRDTVIGGEDPLLHPLTETDIVYPGANRLSVRLLQNGRDPAIIESAVLTFAGETYALTMTPGIDVAMQPAAWLDSQSIMIDQADSFATNEAVATICLLGGECFTRTYKTVV